MSAASPASESRAQPVAADFFQTTATLFDEPDRRGVGWPVRRRWRLGARAERAGLPRAQRMMTEQAKSMPAEIGRANQHDLRVKWQDGHESVYPARELRLACPCAGCVDEMTGVIRVIGSSVPQDVKPLKIELVGRYALTIHWSDGHHTGIYTFELLRKLCSCCRRDSRQ